MDDNNPLLEEYVKLKNQESKEMFLKMAGILRMQYDAFIETGFSKAQALSLVKSLFVKLCTMNLKEQ